MAFIDEKFKDEKPAITVETIADKLNDIGIVLNELWNDSKIENCCSLRVSAKGGVPGTNGKGVSNEFAKASAYGEFIERLQSGLFFYKYQSFENDESVWLHAFAPDKRYMTEEELLQNSQWMEPIAKRYGITKESIAKQCKMYACSDKILCIPFYSLFEDKYVYLPAMFVEHIYGSNGCCDGCDC
jgi:ribosomal protein S12 methylthiotransferase accessory factor